MRITNFSEAMSSIRPRMAEYLSPIVGIDLKTFPKKKFKCISHDDSSPSMHLDPRRNYEVAHCFACGASLDIFDAYALINGIEKTGSDLFEQTLPALASMFGFNLSFSALTEEEKERHKLYRLFEDIAGILSNNRNEEYLETRKWSDAHIVAGTMPYSIIESELLEKGWERNYLLQSRALSSNDFKFVDENFFSFMINDERGRPVAFISRNLGEGKPKYINSAETAIYHKKETLFGLDVALSLGKAKQNGLYIVEGPGDVAALHRVGIYNVAGICGVAFTNQHLNLLKSVGIKQVYFCLDWDPAGQAAIQKILFNEIKFAPGLSCFVVDAPTTEAKDCSEFCSTLNEMDSGPFQGLAMTPAFEWVLSRISDKATHEDTCAIMIPLIASEAVAVRRELLSVKLSEHTGVSVTSIQQDIATIRDGKERERHERIEAATKKYIANVSTDPGNILAALARHELELEAINKDYDKASTGTTYQVTRFDSMEEGKSTVNDKNLTEFQFAFYREFGAALSGGMNACDGNLMFLGGRANSGKTATIVSLGMDVAVHDPNTIVLFHFTDDSYVQVAPRALCNVAAFLAGPKDVPLKIHQAANPYRNIVDPRCWEVYHRATDMFRSLLENEKLVIIDSEDGSTLAPLERQLRVLRSRYPDKKILVILDNVHNVTSYPEKEKTARMEAIATDLKNMTTKYHCCIFGTVEYRKGGLLNPEQMRFPDNDDIADARAMIYRPNVIMHVYQDLHDRGEHATVYWKDKDGVKQPRIFILVGKNKITSFKSPENKLVLDLDKTTVTVREVNIEAARREAKQFLEDLDEIDFTEEAMEESEYA